MGEERRKRKVRKKRRIKKNGHILGGRTCTGSISAVFWRNRVVFLPNNGPASKRKNRKRIKKKREEMGHAQAKWRGGPPTIPSTGLARPPPENHVTDHVRSPGPYSTSL